MITKKRWRKWLKLRHDTANEDGKLCYCGHTDRCTCGDPTFDMFKDHVRIGNIKENDPKNGWKTIN